MGAPRALALCHSFGGALDFQTGDWNGAGTSLRKGIEMYQQVGSASGQSLTMQRLGVLLTAQGQLDEARQIMVEGIVIAERAAMRSHCLTRLHASLLRNRLAAGDLSGAKASLEDGLEAARRHGHCVTCNALLLPEAVRAEISMGNIEAADQHAKALEETATEFESRAWVAMAGHARGRVLCAQADAAAFDVLEKARVGYLDMGQSYEAARCLLAQAEATPKEAAELEKQARGIFSDLGAAGIEN
jgi:tetratricopeptide (TPR) repeat protein